MKPILITFTLIFLLGGCSSVKNERTEESAFGKIVSIDDYAAFELLAKLEGHSDKLWTLDSNGGNTIVSGGLDRGVIIWNTESMTPVLPPFQFTDAIEDVRMLERGDVLALVDDYRLLRINAVDGGTADIGAGRFDRFCVSPDGSLIAGSTSDKITILRSVDLKTVQEIVLPHECFECIISPDNRYVLAAGHEGSCLMWSVGTGKLIRSFEGLRDDVHCLDITPDGKYIAAGATDCRLKVWEVETGGNIATIAHRDGLYDLDISSDGRTVASAGADRQIIITELETGRIITRLRHDDEIHAVAFAAGDSLITAGGYDHLMYVWGIPQIDLSRVAEIKRENAAAAESLRSVKAHDAASFDIAVSGDDRMIATAGRDNLVKLWDSETFELIKVMEPELHIIELKFSGEGGKLLCRSESGVLIVYELKTGGQIYSSADTDMIICGFDLYSEENLLVTGGRHGEVSLWDFKTMELQKQQIFDDYPVFNIKFAPDGDRILFAYAGSTDDFRLTGLDRQLAVLYRTEGHKGYNYHTSFSPDNKLFATAGADALIKLWNSGDGSLHMTLDRHRGKVMDTDFSPDGRLLVSGSAHDHTVKLWNAGTGELLKSISAGNEVQCVEFANSGRFVVSSGEDGTLRFWGLRP